MTAAIYLVKVIVCSGILFSYYWLALRNKSFHQWNRFYLIIITVLSLLLPFVKIPVANNNEKGFVHYIYVSSINDSITIVANKNPFISFTAEHWLSFIYLLASLSVLFLVIKAAKEIIDVLKSYPRQKLEQVNFLNTNVKGAPFSFLNYLVWNQEIDLQSESGKLIFRHELAHIQQKHTLDKILLLLVLIPFWINPFFWIIRKELNAIHEFIADEKALQNKSVEALSCMILKALYPKHDYLLSSPFSQTSIKRRLKMFAIKNQKINYMSRILVLPFLVMVVAAFTLKQKESKEKLTFDTRIGNYISSDTVPNKTNLVIVEEISKPSINKNGLIVRQTVSEMKDTIPNKEGKGVLMDTKNKIYLEASEIVFKNEISETITNPLSAILIVNGKKVGNEILKDKTIISKRITVYPANDKEAIQLYGIEAAKGVMVFDEARIINKAESEIYQEIQRDTATQTGKTSPIFSKVEVEARFAGDWGKFLQENLNAAVPVNNGAPAGQYTVMAQFIVDQEGNISDLKTITNHGFGMEEEIIRVMKLSPKWIPAMQNGNKVTAYRKQPITFVVSKD